MSRRRNPQARSVFRPRVEELDPRIAPAGNVTANLDVPSGKLTILGMNDLTPVGILAGNNNNQLLIVGTAPGAFQVNGLGGTLVNGGVSAAFAGVKTIHIDLGEGNDSVIVQSANLSGALTFIGGNGHDSLAFDGSVGTNQLGSISFTGNAGNDHLRAISGKLVIVGSLSAQTGTGNDLVELGGSPSDEIEIGQVQIVNSHDQLNVVGSGKRFATSKTVHISTGLGHAFVSLQANDIALGDVLTVNSSHGNDSFTLGTDGGTVVGKGVTLNLGQGNTQIHFLGNTHKHTGKINLNAGAGDDSITFNSVDVTGSVTINAGNGATSVFFSGPKNNITNDFKLTSGWGKDLVEAKGANLSIGGSANINFGPGISRVDLANTSSLTIGGPLTITGNGEDDVVRIGDPGGSVTLGPVTVIGGGGNNIVNIRGKTNTINGHFKVHNGNGTDLVQFAATTVNGNLTINNGHGNSEIFFISGRTKITGDFVVLNGAGDDSVNLINEELIVGGKMAVQFGTELGVFEGNATSQISVGKSLLFSGSGLNNRIRFGANLSVGEDLRIETGGGETKVTKVLNVGRNLIYVGKVGSDTVQLTGASVNIGGNTSWNVGKGDSNISLGSLNQVYSGGVTILADEGLNIVTLGASATISMKRLEVKSIGDSALRMISNANLTVLGDVGVYASKGADQMWLSGTQAIGGKLTIDSGAGTDVVSIGTTTVGGATTIRTGSELDQFIVGQGKFVGPVVLDLGAGDDDLRVDDSAFSQAVSIVMGDGNDRVRIEFGDSGQKTVFQNAVTFKLGSGSDLLTIGWPGDVDDFAEFQGGVQIDGGADIDIAEFLPVGKGGARFNVFAVFPTLNGLEAVA